MAEYIYEHRPGYGRDDHMADEIIARAARRLGCDGAGAYVAAAVGMASHPVPMGSAGVRLPVGPGVRAKMERALRAARGEIAWRVDCDIVVVCRRTRIESVEHGWMVAGFRVAEIRRTRIVEERQGRRWREVSRTEIY